MSRPLLFILGTRGSALARAQTTLVGKLLVAARPELSLEEKIITTTGDAKPAMSLHEPTAEGSGLFTRQLEEALLAHEIDAAVHSLKDLPVITPAGLRLAAILPRASTSDLLITLEPHGLIGLASEAVVGTSSPRRVELLRAQREDLKFSPVRGNVPTRLRKLAMNQREHQLDALVLARAGLERLGYNWNLIQEQGFLDFEGTQLFIEELTWMLPAPGQGAIAIETRDEKFAPEVETALQKLHDETTASCVNAERLLLRYLGGGCHMALGALATYDAVTQQLYLQAVYVPSPGTILRCGEATASTPEEVALLVAEQLGEKLASI